MKKLILASASPRRREILSLSGYSFEILISDCDEAIPVTTPSEYVSELSRRKALAVCSTVKDAVVIGADTIVCYGNAILGKPSDKEDAIRMLRKLSGKTHQVFTGVTVVDSDTLTAKTFYEKTEVEFYDLAEEEIRSYVDTGEPLDKAGAYGIQGKGAFLVKKINGDYYNVVGLPYARLLRVLKAFSL